LKLADVTVLNSKVGHITADLRRGLDELTTYSEAGPLIPETFVLQASRIVDLSGLVDTGQVVAMASNELLGLDSEGKIVLLLRRRG
jgi:hypothetical protein